MANNCDGLILNLDSFDTYCQESCTAKAIVPYTKLMLGKQYQESCTVEAIVPYTKLLRGKHCPELLLQKPPSTLNSCSVRAARNLLLQKATVP